MKRGSRSPGAKARECAGGDPVRCSARCLVGYDRDDRAVATVCSAGPGRPGLIEPLGAHADHRGRGHGRAITVACAAVLQEMGASSVTVATPSDNAAGVRGYLSAGFTAQPESTDFRRPASSSSFRGAPGSGGGQPPKD